MTPEQVAEAIAFRDAPLPPEVAARDAAMVEFAARCGERASRMAAELERLFGDQNVLDAFALLWGVCAAEHARAQALDITPLGIEEALAAHGLSPGIERRARNLRASVTN